MAAIIQPTTPSSPYSSNDTSLIASSKIESFFDPSIDYIEFVVNSIDGSYQTIDYDYKNYLFPTNGSITSTSTNQLDINPSLDLSRLGITTGEYNVYYNFYKNQLGTSENNRSLIIKEISADRTEVIVRFISPNVDANLLVNDFISSNTSTYFNDFYLNFSDNILLVANNIQVNLNNDILINLYNPLPGNININIPFWIITKIADTLSFIASFTPEVVTPTVTSFRLKGPNFNLISKDQINNSTNYNDYNTLITSSLLSTSYSQLNNLISSSGININIDYTNFSNFIYFSSAVQRIKNFTTKVTQISSSQAEINILTGSSGYITSSNITILTNEINNIIENFDGYEYYLYYDTGSWSWPKSTSTVPYILYSPTSNQVIDWLGSSDPYDVNYGGILSSASIYDDNNVNYLYKTIPEYLKNDPQNDPYKLFIDLIGQHYDDIWIYYKDVTNLYQADNRLDYGISKDLVAQALRSFGVNLYQNNYTIQDLYSSFLGYGTLNPEMTGSLPVATGSFQEWINNYITASYDASVTPLDDYNKEIYKRIYHNLPYLAKTKGTIPGLRALINCFGVPDTVLRISEFGGRDKDTSTYDYFDQQFNYAFFTTASSFITSSMRVPASWNSGGARPDAIELRIKPFYSDLNNVNVDQIIFETTGSTTGTVVLSLSYTGSGLASSSYSGSISDPYNQYGTLRLDLVGTGIQSTASIYAPFFDGNWWSILINRSGSITNGTTDTSSFGLYVGNKLYYDGYDGNQIGYLLSSSYIGPTAGWNSSGGITYFSSSKVTYYTSNGYKPYEGYAQEIRYWASTQSIDSFKDYIMNPQSIDYSGENIYSDKLIARLPLGGDLYTGSKSVHPKITGSWATTQSFFDGNSDFLITNTLSFIPNIETRFLNSPVVGLRGRVTDKIQIVSSSLPTGSVLSQYISIEQSYPTLGSESPDVNLLEVAFSPQNEINDDIIDSLGYFNIGEYIGDPRQVSSSATSYPDLVNLSNNFFQKYFDTYDLKDYIRLIKYFDNSLFKMIKDFVPARTSLTSGVVIKQHILERNKYPQPQLEWEELDYSGSIDTAFISGSTGGVFNPYNTTTFAQDWIQTYEGPTGISYISHSSQDEFYNGELPGTECIVTNGELNPDNEFKLPTTLEIYYDPTLYLSSITPLEDFLNISTSPNQGEIYLWYDTGSILQPSGPPIQR